MYFFYHLQTTFICYNGDVIVRLVTLIYFMINELIHLANMNGNKYFAKCDIDITYP